MQLNEQLQQHIYSLPMELKAEVLSFILFLEQKQGDNKEQLKKIVSVIPDSVNLVDELIAERRIEAEKNTDDYVIMEDNTQELLEILHKIKPAKCEYTSEQIVRSLRDGTLLE